MPPRSTKNNTIQPGRAAWAGVGRWFYRFSPVLRFVLALLLLPVTTALIRMLVAAERMLGVRSVLGLSATTGMFAAGFVSFALIYTAFAFPARPYVLAHELTHALFGLAHGARVWRFRVKAETGSVRVSGGGVLVLLAPYFFPLYLAGILAVFGLVSLAVPLVDTIAGRVFSGLAGLAWSFHFCFTVNAMLQHQSDLEAYGFFFSFALILLLNVFVLACVFVALSPLTTGMMWTLGREKFIHTIQWFWDAGWAWKKG